MVDGEPAGRGRTALVTGAARGIGRAVAVGLARQGYAVVCTARTLRPGDGPLPGSLLETVAVIEAAGGTGYPVRCDLSAPGGVPELFASIARRFDPGLDVLVHAAMARSARRFDALDLDAWRATVSANLDALYLLCAHAVPKMALRGGGSIVCLTSAMADRDRRVPESYLGYAVAKAAMERMVTALAPQVAGHNVAVNALRPGAIRTEYAEAELGRGFDFGRWREPASVVPAVLELARQRADGVTGQVMLIEPDHPGTGRP